MKKIVTFLTALSLLVTSGMSAYAAATGVTASIDPKTGTITLTGSADGTTTIRVTKADVDIESLSDDNMPTAGSFRILYANVTNGSMIPFNL